MPQNKYAPDFELPGVDEQVYHLSRMLEQYQTIAVVFITQDCPYVPRYLDRLKQIQSDFQDARFTLIAINPSDNLGEMKNYADTHNLNFPYIKDSTLDVTESFGATTTLETFLIDDQAMIRYRGQIDDNLDKPASVTKPYLRNAITSLLKRKPISITSTNPKGSTL